MCFNLHASQLLESGVTVHIRQMIKRYEVFGARLTFELVENVLDLQPQVQESLLRLRVMVCGLSIDDFAVGFFSLKMLCQLPFTEIKLEGEFICKVHEPCSKAVIASTVSLARALNMVLMIESFINQQEYQALINMGCELRQGFYYALPISYHVLLTWLKAPFFAQQESGYCLLASGSYAAVAITPCMLKAFRFGIKIFPCIGKIFSAQFGHSLFQRLIC